MSSAARRLLMGGTAVAASAAAVGVGAVRLGQPPPPLPSAPWADPDAPLPSRREQVRSLRAGKEFDVLVIGGGATGVGAALDAATRGLSVALVEGEDFASGTSSRSTKLVHGGVRYLEKAVFQLDYGQLKLVFEALRERKTLLRNAPHLADALPIATPCYRAWEVPYYWAGMKAYDAVAGLGSLTPSRFRNAADSLAAFPTLARRRSDDGAELKGTIVYSDGQFDDARLAVSLACTAAHAGAVVGNYVRVDELLKDPSTGKVIGARCRDAIGGGGVFDVRAKVVLNATGPFTDGVRRLSRSDRETIMTPAGGAHVTLPGYFAPSSCGLIVPKTKDGRVVFMIPWLGSVIAGTTDTVAPVTLRPRATEEEVDFILDALSPYLSVPATRRDVVSAWSGIRPLAADPSQSGTENLSRDHVVVDEGDGMITATGGKWTTYRLMAEHAVDAVIAVGGEEMKSRASACRTDDVAVVGAHGFRRDLPAVLLSGARERARDENRQRRRRGSLRTSPPNAAIVDETTVSHLARAYGDRAASVMALAESDARLAERLAPGFPHVAAEVAHAARREYCQTTCDFLARRSRLAFLDVDAAEAAIPTVTTTLARELGWGRTRIARETREAKRFLQTFRV